MCVGGSRLLGCEARRFDSLGRTRSQKRRSCPSPALVELATRDQSITHTKMSEIPSLHEYNHDLRKQKPPKKASVSLRNKHLVLSYFLVFGFGEAAFCYGSAAKSRERFGNVHTNPNNRHFWRIRSNNTSHVVNRYKAR